MEEDLGAQFYHNGKRIYRKKSDCRDSYTRNNSRNRDYYGIVKASGRSVDIPLDAAFEYWEENYVNENYEDKFISELTSKKEEDTLSFKEFLRLKEQLTDEVRQYYEKLFAKQLIENT